MTALLNRNWDRPGMGELAAYLEAHAAWGKQLTRLDDVFAMTETFALRVEEGMPPFFVPQDWPSREEMVEITDAITKAWHELKKAWKALPSEKMGRLPSWPQ